jgi:hypothetical protein
MVRGVSAQGLSVVFVTWLSTRATTDTTTGVTFSAMSKAFLKRGRSIILQNSLPVEIAESISKGKSIHGNCGKARFICALSTGLCKARVSTSRRSAADFTVHARPIINSAQEIEYL